MNNILKIAICDDSKIDREIVKCFIDDYLEEHELKAIVDDYSSGHDLLGKLNNNYDILFLDIIMDGKSGIEVAESLINNSCKTKIVFTSSSSDFAEKSYDLNIFHYLIKPIKKEKTDYIIDKYLTDYTSLKKINIKVDRVNELHYIKDILYIEPFGHHSIIHTTKKAFEATDSYASLLSTLDDKSFLKASRYAYCNMEHIKEINNNNVTLSNNEVISLSRNFKNECIEKYYAYKNKK